jgi:hypothetical protein
MLYRCFFIILCTLAANAVAAERDIRSQAPLPAHALNQATMMQAEVLKLAKTTAKREKGRKSDGYEVKSVVFDPQSREWTVSFDPGARHNLKECFLVIVNDDTRETKVLRC